MYLSNRLVIPNSDQFWNVTPSSANGRKYKVKWAWTYSVDKNFRMVTFRAKCLNVGEILIFENDKYKGRLNVKKMQEQRLQLAI